MATKRDTGTQLFGFLFALGALGVLGLIGRAFMTEEDKKQVALQDKYGGDVIPIDDLPRRHSLPPGSYQATLMRQSGNVHRELGVFSSPEAALREGVKSLRRAQVSDVRITHRDSDSLAAYRQFYNLRGRAEGKKLAGIVIRRVDSGS